jgi:iron complex outermembrane receptor protein
MLPNASYIMIFHKYFFILIFCCGYMQRLSAQSHSCKIVMQGNIVFNDSSKNILAGISVLSKKLGQGVVTDSSGHYIIANLCPGKQNLEVKRVGYKIIDTVIYIKHDITVDFSLSRQTIQLAEVTINGSIVHKDQITTAVKSTLSGQALEETRGLSLGESLKGIPGLNSIQNGPNISKPVIHGVYSNRILIMNNGVRQEGQTWGNDHAPEIDPFIATKITVIKGAASIRYGSDAIGGVILLEPKDLPTTPGVDGEINLVGMTNSRLGATSGMIEGAAADKLKGLNWRLQGTLKQAGNSQTPTYYIGNTGLEEDDYSATLGYTKLNYGVQLYYSRFDTKIGIATASHVGTIADLNQAIMRKQPAVNADFTYDIVRPYQTVNHQLFKADGFINLSHNMGKIEGTYAFQKDIRKEYDADASFNDSIARLNPADLYFNLNTTTVDLIWEHPAVKKIQGSVGINFITHGNIQQGTGYQELIPNFEDYGGGIFAIEKYQYRKLIIEGGLRYDYKWMRAYTIDGTTLAEKRPTYSWQKVSTNLGAIYNFSNDFSIRYNFGTSWRPPQVIELFANGIHQSAASWENGDSSLTLEKSYNNTFGLTYRHLNFTADIDLYANYFNGYIYLRPDSLARQTIQGAFPSFTYTQVKSALFKGIDLMLSYKFFNHLLLTSKSTVVRARNRDDDTWLINIPADRFDNSLRYDFNSKGNWKNIFLSISNLQVNRQTRVPPDNVVKDYEAPPAGYNLWGAEAGFTVPAGNQHFDISFSVNDLFNVSYHDYLDRFRYFVFNPGRNFTLRVTMPFNLSKYHT